MCTDFLFKTKKAYTKTTCFLSPPFYVAVILFTASTFETLNVSELEMYKQMLKSVWLFAVSSVTSFYHMLLCLHEAQFILLYKLTECHMRTKFECLLI